MQARFAAFAAVLLAGVAAASAAPSLAAETSGDVPTLGALYEDGPDGRYLIGGDWLVRTDPADAGLRSGYARASDADGWSARAVPYAWNASDLSDESMAGSIAWYRKDFRAPSDPAALRWALRFESVNHRARVFLDGREIGRHEGAYLPFELSAGRLAGGTLHRLVVRVDSRRTPFDLPPGGVSADGRPAGGWWNYGGVLREVYLRRIAATDFAQVAVTPRVGCRSCPATIDARVTLKNTTATARTLSVRGRIGSSDLVFSAPRTVARGKSSTFTARLRIARPRLWEPGRARLYTVRLFAGTDSGPAPRYTLRVGIRRIDVDGQGRLLINGRRKSLRGASLHEDDPELGSALSQARRRGDVALLQTLGATMTRAHYPLHPYTLELLDRAGIMLWGQAPIYQLSEEAVVSPKVERKAVRVLRDQVRRDRNHPSVLAWSIANELPSRADGGHEDLVRRAAAAVRRLDRTRLVAIDIQGYPSVGAQETYRDLDAIGINDYFGWYPGPNGSVLERGALGPYLDQMHQYYPRQALFVTEVGAEANRDGPIDEKGTYSFQSDFLRYHLGVIGQRPFMNGALVWILRDFRVRPGWDGGNPKPDPPTNFKGLVDARGKPKPAFDVVRGLIAGSG